MKKILLMLLVPCALILITAAAKAPVGPPTGKKVRS